MTKSATYKTSGVDIDKANAFVKKIKGFMTSTMSPFVLKRKGAFGGLFALDTGKYKNPVLVSGIQRKTAKF